MPVVSLHHHVQTTFRTPAILWSGLEHMKRSPTHTPSKSRSSHNNASSVLCNCIHVVRRQSHRADEVMPRVLAPSDASFCCSTKASKMCSAASSNLCSHNKPTA